MQWTSIIAIYALIWVMSAFVMMPLGLKTHDEAGVPKVPGQADSAPANFRPGRVVLRATILATVLCAPWSVPDHRGAAARLAPLKKAAKALRGASWVLGRADAPGHEVRRGTDRTTAPAG